MAIVLNGTTGIVQANLGTNVAGTGPAFSVSRITTNQAITAVTYTKVQFNSVNFDTSSDWDAANYRFLPTVAGYYQININLALQTSTGAWGEGIGVIYKNGLEQAWNASNTGSNTRVSTSVSTVVYLNGSTDYIEAYAYIISGTSPIVLASTSRTQMSGALIRSAT